MENKKIEKGSNLFWKKEKKRWELCSNEIKKQIEEEIFSDYRKSEESETSKKIFNQKMEKLGKAHRLFSDLILDSLLEIIPKLFEKYKEGKYWDKKLSSGRAVAFRFPHSIIVNFVLRGLKLDGLGRILSSYVQEVQKLSGDANNVFIALDKYLKAWDDGAKIIESYKTESQENLLSLYASCKTWEEDKQLESFHRTLSNFGDTTIKLLIEDLITLYLMISADGNFCIIIRSFLSDNLSDLLKINDKDNPIVEELKNSNEQMRNFIEKNLTLKFFVEIFKGTVKEAIAEWHKGEKNSRIQQPTKERKQRYIKIFEQGLLFAIPAKEEKTKI